LIIKGGKVALPDAEEPVEKDIRIEGEKIVEIGDDLKGDDILDASGLLVIPGGIDPHVHFDDPGYTEREDFYHGSMAAASGGITTVIDMPCTSVPPVTNLENLKRKLDVIGRKSIVDYGFFGGVSAQSFEEGFPYNIEELSEYVLGFKTYFISGMPTFERLEHYQFREVLKAARKFNLPVLLHAEDFEFVKKASEIEKKKGNNPQNYYNSRPEIAELIAIATAAIIAREVDARLHIVHLGTAEAAELFKYTNLSFETAPHYLEFSVEDFIRIGSPLKVTPPVKGKGNREKLWSLLNAGKISFVASDHAPCPEIEKNTGSIWTDYSGIPGTGTLLPYLFSEGYMKGRLSWRRFVETTSSAAAKYYGLYHRKGSIEVGKDADLVLIDPQRTWIVEGNKFFSKGKITPFEGMEFKGRIVKTIVRGRVVYDEKDGITVEPGYGIFLKRKG